MHISLSGPDDSFTEQHLTPAAWHGKLPGHPIELVSTVDTFDRDAALEALRQQVVTGVSHHHLLDLATTTLIKKQTWVFVRIIQETAERTCGTIKATIRATVFLRQPD